MVREFQSDQADTKKFLEAGSTYNVLGSDD